MHIHDLKLQFDRSILVFITLTILVYIILGCQPVYSMEASIVNYGYGVVLKLSNSSISSVGVVSDSVFIASSNNDVYIVYINVTDGTFRVWNRTLPDKVELLALGGFNSSYVALSTVGGEVLVIDLSMEKLSSIRELLKVTGHKSNVKKVLLDSEHGILLVLDDNGLLYVYNVLSHGRLEIGYRGIHNGKLVKTIQHYLNITNITSISIVDVVLRVDYYECRNSYNYNSEYTLVRGLISTYTYTYTFMAILNFTSAPLDYNILYLTLLPTQISGPMSISRFTGRDILVVSYVDRDVIKWIILKRVENGILNYTPVTEFYYPILGTVTDIIMYHSVNSVYTIVGGVDNNVYMFNISTDIYGEVFNFKLEWSLPINPLAGPIKHIDLIWAWRRLEYNIMGFILVTTPKTTQLVTLNCGLPLWIQEHGLPVVGEVTDVSVSTTGNLIVYGLSDGRVFILQGLKRHLYAKGLPEYFKVKVRVLLNNTKPLVGVTVELLDELYRVVARGLTNNIGEVVFYTTRGIYYVRVFEETLGEITGRVIVGFRWSIDPVLNFKLYNFTVEIICEGDPYGIGFGKGPIENVEAQLIPLEKGLPVYKGVSNEKGVIVFDRVVVNGVEKYIEPYVREGKYVLILLLPDGRVFERVVYVNSSKTLEVKVPASLETLVLKILDEETLEEVYPVKLMVKHLASGVKGVLLVTSENSTLKLPRGVYELKVLAKGYKPLTRNVSIPGITVLYLTPVKYELTILVVDEFGSPVNRFYTIVSWGNWTTHKSGINGTVSFHLRPGLYRIKVYSEGFKPSSKVIEFTKNTTVNIVLYYPRYKLTVNTLDRDTLKPVTAVIEVLRGDRVVAKLKPPFTTIILPRGVYLVNIIPEGPYPKRSVEVTLDSDRELRILLSRRPYTLRIIVRDEKGIPLSGVRVVISNSEVVKGRTRANGEFSLNLPPGRYIVRVDYEGYTSVVREVVLNRNVMLEFKLKPTIQTVITRLVMSNLNYIIVVVVGVIVGVVFIKYVKPKLKRRREISEEELFEELYSTA